MSKKVSEYLPLSEATFCILLALTHTMHGYAIMQKVEAMSEGAIHIGPGTLYGALTVLEKERLIAMVEEKERRKSYALTALGKEVLLAEVQRLEMLALIGRQATQNIL
jgi:DNA-binding PadR family transcriptional regulator